MKALVVVLLTAFVAACSGGGGQSGPSQAVADAWPGKWCEATPGIAGQQLAILMGPPTSKSDTTMSWSAHQYQFNAFLDPDGSVHQLDINFHSLSEAEKSAMKCDKVRTRESMDAQTAAATPARATPDACTLVSAAEMSAILGSPVEAQAPKPAKCIYQPASGASPYVEFSVDWGDGAAGMAGVGFASAHEPGLTSPYDGLGDQAVAVGPALMIRTGEDLVTIVFSGVDDVPAAAKKIFDTAKAKL